jgi:hypothetical protein
MNVDGVLVLSELLLTLRTWLSFYQGAYDIIFKEYQVAVPNEVILWLSKWLPYIEELHQEERILRSKCEPDLEIEQNWEELISRLGERLSKATIAQQESRLIKVPDDTELQVMIEMAIRAVSGLDRMRQDIVNGRYYRYLATGKWTE